ncbi:hypothetical protein GmHk_14G041589 [Glycine max]|nr:hypothetical protein GmHk_14G041589 [Glycine max]
MIDTFETLAMKFSIQFITGRPHHLNSMALVNIRKETKESLRTSFMEHFGKVVFIIRNLDHEVSLHPWDRQKRNKYHFNIDKKSQGHRYAHYIRPSTNGARILDEALNTYILQQPRKDTTPFYRTHTNTSGIIATKITQSKSVRP